MKAHAYPVLVASCRGYRESIKGCLSLTVPQHLPVNVFKLMLDYLYTGTVSLGYGSSPWAPPQLILRAFKTLAFVRYILYGMSF